MKLDTLQVYGWGWTCGLLIVEWAYVITETNAWSISEDANVVTRTDMEGMCVRVQGFRPYECSCDGKC